MGCVRVIFVLICMFAAFYNTFMHGVFMSALFSCGIGYAAWKMSGLFFEINKLANDIDKQCKQD